MVVGGHHALELAFQAAVAAVAIGVIAAHQIGIAAAQRGTVRVETQAQRFIGRAVLGVRPRRAASCAAW
jgi:hypothetical protein